MTPWPLGHSTLHNNLVRKVDHSSMLSCLNSTKTTQVKSIRIRQHHGLVNSLCEAPTFLAQASPSSILLPILSIIPLSSTPMWISGP